MLYVRKIDMQTDAIKPPFVVVYSRNNFLVSVMAKGPPLSASSLFRNSRIVFLISTGRYGSLFCSGIFEATYAAIIKVVIHCFWFAVYGVSSPKLIGLFEIGG